MSPVHQSWLLCGPLLFCSACGAPPQPTRGGDPAGDASSSVSPPTDPGPSSPGSGGRTSGDELGLGGSEAEPDPHPLFFAGDYASVDTEDPCAVAPIWKEETAIDLDTGSWVIYEGTLWELTGTISENWALPDCTPPGRGWCGEQYAWKEMGSCPL